MKKLIALLLTGVMLFGTVSSVLADDNSGVTAQLTLSETSRLKLDRSSGYIDMIDGTVTVAELKANFASDVVVIGADGKEKVDNTDVATDDTVTMGKESIKALIYGDCDRDGKINIGDVTSQLKNVAGWSTDVSVIAGDVDKTGDIDLSDVTKLLKKIAGWGDISLGNVRMVFENKKLIAENEDTALSLYFETPLRKIERGDVSSTGEYSYKMKLARNETESCQFFVSSTEKKDGLTAELTEFVHEYGEGTLKAEILREYYYDLAMFDSLLPVFDATTAKGGYYVDPLIPNDTSFEVMENTSQGFMVNVTTDETTPEGMYKAALNIKDADGKVIKTADLYVYVWDFTLPVTPYSASAFGMTRSEISGRGSSDKYATPEEQYIQYYEMLLDYNISPSEIPYDLLDDRANAFMDDPRLTSFRTMPELGGYAYTDFFGDGDIFHHDWDPEVTGKKLIDTMEKVNSKQEWAEKSYFTIMDEPYDVDTYNRIKNVDDWMKGLLGDTDYNLMLCMASNGVYSHSPDFIDLALFVKPYLDIWCPSSAAYTLHDDPNPSAVKWNLATRSYKVYGNYIDRRAGLADEGDRQWWYICCAPEAPYPNYFNFYHGCPLRVVLWQQYMFDVEGILYWDTTAYWSAFSKYVYGGGNGDGLLMYPGNFYGYNGVPIASYRLVQIRDSFDDYDYLTMAEEIAGAEAVDKILHTVTTSSLVYTEDPDVMEAARDALAEIIVGEYN